MWNRNILNTQIFINTLIINTMRNLFTTLKSLVAVAIAASMTLAACSYDDTAIKNKIDKVEKDLTALTERVNALEQKLNAEAPTLEDLLDGKLVVTEVTTDADGNTILKLSDGSTVTVLAGCDCVPCDCEPVEPCDCDPLEYRVVDGVLEVSADGENWIALGVAPECVIAEAVVNDDNTLTLTLADGSTFTVVKADLIEFDATRGSLYVKPGETKEITFTINDAVADVNVMNQPLGWKAEIVLAPADEDAAEGDEEVDPGMGVMAAGGTDFVLRITAPSQALVDGGIAEKVGAITVHFNSNGGACKVGKIAVELAALLLEVDKEGNVTVTNTLVDTYEYEEWGVIYETSQFNNYYFTIMPLEYYTEDLASLYNASWWEWNVPAAAGFINNFFYNVNSEYNTYDKATYVEGENEQWIFKASIKEIIGILDWYGALTYEGESFAVIVTPCDVNAYGAPIMEQSQVAIFKQLSVKAEVAETTWNNVYLNASLRGATAYQFNINTKAELDQYIYDWQYYADEKEYYETYIYYWQNYGSQFGSHRVATDVKADGIAFNDLINYGEEYPWAYELAPNTEYKVAILAEQDGKTEYTYEDLYIFSFTTKDIVAASTPFEYTIALNEEDTNYLNIYADVTVPETAVAVYSAWYNESFVTDEELKDALLNDGWIKNDFSEGYTYNVNTSVYEAGSTKYLGLLILDAEGNYSTGWAELKSKEPVYNAATLTIESVEFLTDGTGVANVTLGGIDGLEVTEYVVFAAKMSGYYKKSEEELQELSYNDIYYSQKYTTNPFVLAKYDYSSTTVTDGETYQIAVAARFADNTVSNVAYGEYTYGSVPELNFTIAEDLGDNKWKFSNADGEYVTVPFYSALAAGTYAPYDGYNVNSCEVYAPELGFVYDGAASWFSTGNDIVVTEAAGVYTVVIKFAGCDVANGYAAKNCVATFVGSLGGDNGGNEGGEADGSIVMTTLGTSYMADTFCKAFPFSDESGNNAVTLVVDNHSAVINDFPAANSYATFQSSVSYITQGTHFSFVNQSLKVNGVAYANDAVSNVSLSVVNGDTKAMTLTFTVNGEEYTFKYNN